MESADAELLDDNEAVAIPDKTKDEKKRKMVLNKRKTKYVKMTWRSGMTWRVITTVFIGPTIRYHLGIKWCAQECRSEAKDALLACFISFMFYVM